MPSLGSPGLFVPHNRKAHSDAVALGQGTGEPLLGGKKGGSRHAGRHGRFSWATWSARGGFIQGQGLRSNAGKEVKRRLRASLQFNNPTVQIKGSERRCRGAVRKTDSHASIGSGIMTPFFSVPQRLTLNIATARRATIISYLFTHHLTRRYGIRGRRCRLRMQGRSRRPRPRRSNGGNSRRGGGPGFVSAPGPFGSVFDGPRAGWRHPPLPRPFGGRIRLRPRGGRGG